MKDRRIIDCDRDGPVPEAVEEDGANVVAFGERRRTMITVGGGLEYDVDDATLLERGRS